MLPENTCPTIQPQLSDRTPGYLAPIQPRKFMSAPRTPSAQLTAFGDYWSNNKQQNIGELISRPMSACSIMSNSSDESDRSSVYSPSLGGSCTSPESDAPDPFTLLSLKKGKSKIRPSLPKEYAPPNDSRQSTQTKFHWTPDMDKHIWTTYMIYLQDPTVTPFKMLPGSSPPLGVCHRVAREAKRTWRGSKSTANDSSLQAFGDTAASKATALTRSDSPDTIKASRSGSTTPTTVLTTKLNAWPKSRASTRRRLRELCKRRATIAPHYQRLLHGRSSSPFTSSPHSNTRSSRFSSPFGDREKPTAFGTRAIHVSLTTSTAASMQPDGPLAQLATQAEQQPNGNNEWFNNPTVPWASPAVAPSDLPGLSDTAITSDPPSLDDVPNTSDLDMGGVSPGTTTDLPRLASPFAYHTWGPSRSRQHLRPPVPRTQSDDVPPQISSLRSPIQLHSTFPYPSALKRRAQHQLEDELSPGGTDIRKDVLDNLFGSSEQIRHRRVRNRAVTLGNVSVNDRMASLFTPPSGADTPNGSDPAQSAASSPSHLGLVAENEAMKTLGSPFSGIGIRPSRSRGRHNPSASLSSYDPGTFASIDQRLGQFEMISQASHGKVLQ